MTVPGDGAASLAAGPYKFLDYFAEDEGDRFFGRADDVAEVVAGIARERAFVVYGPSGTGKTSLMRAGVARVLARRGFVPVYARVLRSPVDDLRAAVARALGEPGPGAASLRELLARAARGGGEEARPVVVILDQFEEFFIRWRSAPDEKRRFVEAIGALLRDDALDVRVVFSLREDYLAELDAFRAAAPDLLDHRYRLVALTAFGAREAIARPLMEAGVDCAPRLLDRLVDRVGELGFDPAMLQIVCSEVYKEAIRRGGAPPRLEEQDLEAIGDVDGIFRRYLDQVTKWIPDGQHLLARSVLDALITANRTKRAVTVASLLSASFTATEQELAVLLEVLVEQRLLRRELRGDETWYELVHDRLVAIVLGWLERDREFFQFRAARELIKNSSRTGLWRRNPGALLNRGQVDGVVGPYKERLRLGEQEQEFVLRSAVCRRSATAGFWAERYGWARSAAMLQELLASEDAELRLGGAAAAAALPDEDGALARTCLEVAMGDASLDVRRAAGRSLAKLARQPQLAQLHQALRRGATHAAALEVLADMEGGGRAPAEFAWWKRVQARAIARRRLLREHDEEIRARRNDGATRGALASLVWAGTVLPVIKGVSEIASTGVPAGASDVLAVLITVGTTMVGVGALMIGVGALAGFAAADSAARRAVQRGEERSTRAGAVPRGVAGALSAAVAGVVVVILAPTLSGVSGDFVAGATLSLLVMVAALAHLVQLRRVRGEPATAQLSWALVAGVGLPLMVPSGLLAAIAAVQADVLFASEWSPLPGALLFAEISSGLVTAVAFSLGVRSRRGSRPEAPVSASRAREARTILLGACAGPVLLLALWLKRDMFPSLAPVVDVTPGSRSSVALQGSLPDRRYVKLRAPEDTAVLLRFEGARPSWAHAGTTALMAPGAHLIDVYSHADKTQALPRRVDLEVLAPGTQVTLGPAWSYSLIKMTAADSRWTGTFEAPRSLDGDPVVAVTYGVLGWSRSGSSVESMSMQCSNPSFPRGAPGVLSHCGASVAPDRGVAALQEWFKTIPARCIFPAGSGDRALELTLSHEDDPDLIQLWLVIGLRVAPEQTRPAPSEDPCPP